ncbi:reverse transcriptase domain-containing protein [Flavisolibacter tropicus]|uniref:reverse transcriptase domain-containing protein n=1 Tax=Flavisolibacter tropicus TaxID=1492898 RepID=UPI001313F7DA|nr:reverse transcriptase domain-containing protein [Flavisolibacter tropicus]
MDIKGFFDNINHEIMMELLQKHTDQKWVLLYVEHWLKAGVAHEDGRVGINERDTPQGGVISPLHANIYLHHCFDVWMDPICPHNAFERYADDLVIYASSRMEAELLLGKLRERMMKFKLELHPEKLYHRRSSQPLEQTALKLNPKIRGWINYFSKYNRYKVLNVFMYLNTLIKKWIRNTYKLRSISRVVNKYNEMVKASPEMFYHWKLGITY